MGTDDFDGGYADGYGEGMRDARAEVLESLRQTEADVLYRLRKDLNYFELKFAGESDAKVQGSLEGYREAVKRAKESR